jgi:asparagine synthetase B (glutamine-hydrolysing)
MGEIISKTEIEKNQYKDMIEKMNNTIMHRSLDGGGYYYGDNFVFTHRT